MDQQTLQHPNPHQPWCDLNTCSIDTDLTTVHMSLTTETPINTHSRLVSILHRASDGLGTRAFVDLTGDDPYTADELDAMASMLGELAAQVRATP